MIHLHAEEVRFKPDTITVKVGQAVSLTLDNHDPVVHDLTADVPVFLILKSEGADHGGHPGNGVSGSEPGPLHIAAEASTPSEIVFEVSEPGEYEVYCTVTGHRENGMVGKIIVET